MTTGLRASKKKPEFSKTPSEDMENEKIHAKKKRLRIIESIVHAYSLNLPEEEQRKLISRLYAQKRECEAILDQ